MIVNLLAVDPFCYNTANIWQVVGYALTIFKIVIPLLLIIFGMIDLGKAVVGSKDDEIKKAIGSLAKRAIAGIVIFFIPTIVSMIIGLVQQKDESGIGEWDVCRACITNPGSTKDGKGCATYAKGIWDGYQYDSNGNVK